MRGGKLVVLTMAVGAIATGLGGCTSTMTRSVGGIDGNDAVSRCIKKVNREINGRWFNLPFLNGDKTPPTPLLSTRSQGAPQIMTYDSATGTETRMNSAGDQVTFNVKKKGLGEAQVLFDGKKYVLWARDSNAKTGAAMGGGLSGEEVSKFRVCREAGPGDEVDPVALTALLAAFAAGYATGQ
ncbi:MAG: hypothetical protein QM667_11055 [Asticcacaulis sp.]